MLEAPRTFYRCVCGTDVPLTGGDELTCAACGRRLPPEMVTPGTETAFFASGQAAGKAETVRTTAAGIGTTAGVADDGRASLVGHTLDHFEVLEELGRGGMGTVYRALDRSLERYVALKVLDSEAAREQADLIEAFTHEARTQARMSHPGITTIYYIGRFQGMTYFAMEMVPGRNLETLLKAGRLPFREVAAIGIQIVQALKEARARGVTHRDIKPGNLILSDSGRVKVTDFGLSKTDKGGLQITGSRHITGTPFYIAPEQARGETTDFRTDIYSLGATLYHLAYGRPPFDGGHFMAVVSKHLTEPVRFPEPPPKDVAPAFPAIIERMMAKRPEDRFQSYEELEEELHSTRPEALAVTALGRRVTAFVLDIAALALYFTVILGLVGMSAIVFKLEETVARRIGVLAWGVGAAAVLGVFAWWKTTPGKLFGKIRIARLDGRVPEPWRLLARGAFQYLPFLWPSVDDVLGTLDVDGWRRLLALAVLGLFIVDHAWCLWNPRRQTLHDQATDTWVLDRE